MRLSVVIITHNEEAVILRCLESVRSIADEILVVDSFSTDRTADLCKACGCHVLQKEFTGYGPQKQFAVNQAANDWVLSLDADEVVTSDLALEINREIRNNDYEIQKSGYKIPFSLHYMGKILKHSGVGNERHLRIFDRRKGGFSLVPVHEGIEITGSTGVFSGKIIHYSYRDIRHHIDKINTYTSRAAEGYVRKGRSFPKWWVALKMPVSFFTFYFIKGGILDGYPGFIWSFLAAFYASLKIVKTIEISMEKK
jgi:glycosyltransferase involved in cell wall biosynthesis